MAENDNGSKLSIKGIEGINKTVNSMLGTVGTSTLGLTIDREREREELEKNINISVTSEYEKMAKYASSKDFTMMLNQLISKNNSDGFTGDIDKLLGDNVNGMGTYFNDKYRNINYMYEDLKLLMEHVHELDTAVTTMRDSIVSADTAGATLTKTISFSNVSEEREAKLKDMVSEIEKKYKLEDKLHDIIVPDTLIYGNYFVMTMPYNKIFSKFSKRNGMGISAIREATTIDIEKAKKDTAYMESIDVQMLVESYKKDNIESDVPQPKILRDFVVETLGRTEVITDGDLPLLEDASIASLTDQKLLDRLAKKKMSKGSRVETTADGTIDTSKMYSDVAPEYKDVTGVYVKLLPPLRVVPEYVLDECIGYYVLYENMSPSANSTMRSNMLSRGSGIYNLNTSKETESILVDTIVKKIVEKTDDAFIKNNPQFRELIANALMYDDLYKKDFRMQFVSAEYITHFKINENIETHLGISSLKKSIFYGKMYMMLLLYTIISIVTRGSDMRLFNIRNSGIDKNPSKITQQTARNYKENQISYNDLGSFRTLLNKTGKAKDMFVNTGPQGEKPFDIDVVAGQDVQFNTDLLEFLRNNMINGTDVPSVISEYTNTADYAKGIEMGHMKYNSSICSKQREFEPNCAELYGKLLRYEYSDVTESEINSLEFKLQRPKALNSQNGSDIVSSAEQIATFLVKVLCGDSTEVYDELTKDELFKFAIKQMQLPGILDNFELFEEQLAKIQALSKLRNREKELSPKSDEE